MNELYDRQYRKIVELTTIADGANATFETGGSKVRVARNGQRVSAFEMVEEQGLASSEQELPAEVRDGWVWVCIDICS